jgi:hypothetical protein
MLRTRVQVFTFYYTQCQHIGVLGLARESNQGVSKNNNNNIIDNNNKRSKYKTILVGLILVSIEHFERTIFAHSIG